MNIISLRQPYAAAVLLGALPGIDLAKRSTFRGPLLIHAGVRDRVPATWFNDIKMGDGKLAGIENAIIGMITVNYPAHIEDCQLFFLRGPHVLVTQATSARIFVEPITCHPVAGGVRKLEGAAMTANVDIALQSALDVAHWQSSVDVVDLSNTNVLMPGPDGWTGD